MGKGGDTVTFRFRGEMMTLGRRVYVGNLAWETKWQDLKDHANQYGTCVYADVMTQRDGRSSGCGIVEFESAHAAKEALQAMHDTNLDGRDIFCREDKEDRDLGGKGAPPSKGGGKRGGFGKGGGGGRGSGYGGRGGYDRGYERGYERDYDRRDRRDRYERRTPPRRSGGYKGGYSNDDDRVLSMRDMDGNKISVARRVYVGNLAWRTSWQDLKDHFRTVGEVRHAKVFQEDGGRSKGAGIVEFEHPEGAKRAIQQLHDTALGGRTIMVREDREDRALTGQW